MATIKEYIQANRDQIVKDLMEFISIPATMGEPKPDMPYGEDPAKSLAWAKKYAEDAGLGFKLRTESKGEYALYTLGNEGKELGLFCHTDVVPRNGDWQFTEPFKPIIRNNYIVGRGVRDDKGSVIASIYALKAIQAAGIKLDGNVVLFLGANEETGFQDVIHYVEKNGCPDFSLAVDCEFPVCRGEKSYCDVKATCGKKFENILSWEAGEQAGTVPGKVVVEVPYSQALEAEIKKAAEGEKAEYSLVDNKIILVTEGISHHGSNPKGTINAGAVAARILMACPSLGKNDIEILGQFYPLINTYFGEPYNFDLPDRTFGRITTCYGKQTIVDGCFSMEGWIILAPKYSLEKDVFPVVEKNYKEMGWTFEVLCSFPGFEMPEDTPEIQILNNEYLKILGEQVTPVYVSRGQTYASRMQRCVAVGIDAPKFEAPADYLPGHGGVHCPDESVEIDQMLTGIELLANDIIALSKHLAK